MVFIRIKLKGYIENKVDKTKEKIDVYAIRNKNKINYICNDTTYKINKQDDKVILLRENKNFSHKFIFDIDNITKSEYYIKELNTNIDVLIKTTKLIYNDKEIKIDYEIVDSDSKYSYILDME